MLDLLFSKTGLGLIAAALLLSVFGVQEIRLMGAQHEVASMKAAQDRAKADVKTHEATAAAITTKAATDLSATHDANRARTITLIKRIPYAVPASSDCPLPRDAVSVWNAAASGPDAGLPASAGGSDKTPSGLHLADALNNAVENYGIAYDWKAESLTWRRWYSDQAAAWGHR